MHHTDLTYGLQDSLRLAVGIPQAAVAMQFNDASAAQIMLQAESHDE